MIAHFISTLHARHVPSITTGAIQTAHACITVIPHAPMSSNSNLTALIPQALIPVVLLAQSISIGVSPLELVLPMLPNALTQLHKQSIAH